MSQAPNPERAYLKSKVTSAALVSARPPPLAVEDIKPISRVAMVEEVIDRLKTLVRSGRVRPGERLPSERELAALLGISRPSLREAIRTLQYFGVVEVRHGAGTYLNPRFSPLLAEPLHFMLLAGVITLFDLFRARKVMEVGIVGVAAIERTPADLEQMAHALQRLAAAVADLDEYVEWDHAFHRAVYAAAHSSILEAQMIVLNLLLQESRRRTSGMSSDLRVNVEMHRRIFEKVQAGDSPGAQQAMLEHLERGEALLRQEEIRTRE